jgi:hypothetical protein
MTRKPPSALRSVLLVWVIGLVLGIVAGAATAMLLMPKDDLQKAASS